MISDDDIAKVREATDLVALIGAHSQVRRRGRDYWCCCPLHHEKTPSFKIDPTTQLWHCFGCGEGGDAFKFVMRTEGVSFPEAVTMLADAAGIQIEQTGPTGMARGKKQRLQQVCEAACDFWHTQLMRGRSKGAADARAYLAGRGFGSEVSKRWRLGFAPGRGSLVAHLQQAGFSLAEMLDANVVVRNSSGRYNDRFYNRVMFPIFDTSGACIAFGGRVIGDGSPKYLNSSDTPLFHKSSVLYGLDRAKAAMASTGIAVICEGYTDTIAMHEAGITNAVATLGTALTAKHIKLLSRHAGKKIVYMFDGDTAGQRATDRALQFIDESFASAGPGRIDLCALTLPDGLDPAEFLAKYDGPTLNQMIAEAPSLLMFGIERRLAKYDLSSVEDKYRALADALSILAPIKRTLMAKDYAVKVAGMLGLDEADVLDQLMATPVPVASLPQNREADYPRSLGSASKSGTLRAPDGTQSDYPPADIDAACGAPSDIQAFDVPAVKLPTSEVNRLKLEREILSLAAQYPSTAIRFAPDLQACAWHDSLHAHLAGAILNTLVNNPMADAAAMVEAAMSVDDRAGSILTSALCEPEAATARMSMLINQLKRGDLQQKIREGKARLQTLPPDAQQTEFAQLVALQNQLAAMDAQID